MALKALLERDRGFFGRALLSVVLFVLFLILSVASFYSPTLHDMPWLVGGLLIVSVLILPRSARHQRPQRPAPTVEHTDLEGEVAAPQETPAQTAAFWQRVEKQLTVLRLIYLILAVVVWFGLPKLLSLG